MKKLFIIFIVFILSNLNCYAITNDTDKAQIKSLLGSINKYSNEHNIDKLKPYYSKDYLSYDGFNYDAFFVSVKETFKTYPDISYKSKIKSINVSGDFAAVEMADTSTSTRQTLTQSIVENKPVLNQKLNGLMKSKCHYIVYLKKTKGKWQIYSDNIITEETAIRYGKAQEIDMDIVSPQIAKEGEEYCIGLDVAKKPKDSFILASLSREEIKYPPKIPADAFRKMPSKGMLERIVIANKKGMNEYSLASVGITTISLNKEKTAINYQMSGIAFLMKRVNVYAKKNTVDKEYIDKMLNKEPL